MLPANHHAHTYFSDGHGTAEAFLQEAIDQGLRMYGFSDHAPIPLNDMGTMKMAELPTYNRAIEGLRTKYADQIQVSRSLEVDYIPGVMSVQSPHILAAELDYTVGAVHFVDYLADGHPWSFQRPEPVFAQGIEQIFGGRARAMVERYYALVREMITTAPPDVVAHLDRIKKRNVNSSYWSEQETWYRAAVEETLDAVQGAGCIMEVNTRGLYRHGSEETYPSRWIVERAHQRGIPLQVNSDAHEVPNITGGFDFTYAMLSDLGIEEETMFLDKRWQVIDLVASQL